jgi:hypothetical protein
LSTGGRAGGGPGTPEEPGAGRAPLDPAAGATDGPPPLRRAGRRRTGLSEIDAEIKTLEGGFANVIYLATER